MSEALKVDTAALAAEIGKLSKRGILRYDDDELHGWIIRHLAHARFPSIRRSRDAVVRLTLSAIARLSEPPAGRQHAAKVLFGLAPGTAKLGTGARQRRAADSLHIPFQTFRTGPQHMRAMHREIVDAVIEVVATEHESAAGSSPFAVGQPPLVVREKLLQRLHRLTSSGHTVIGIVGAPGVGKTTLARQLTCDETTAYLDATNSETLTASALRSMLEAEYELSGEPADFQFAKYIASDFAPRFVVVDNVQAIDQVERFVTTRTKSIVVLTSRTMLVGLQAKLQVEVDNMEPPEASELAGRLVPARERESASSLARAVGNNPLAVVAASSLLNLNEGLSVSDLLRSLESSPSFTLRGLPADSSSKLYELYRQTIHEVEAQSRLSSTMLVYAALFADTAIPRDVLADAACIYIGIRDGDREVATTQAMRILRGHFLVQEQDNGLSLRIHKITRTILRDLYRDLWGIEIATPAIACFAEYVSSSRSLGMRDARLLELHSDTMLHLSSLAVQPGVPPAEIEILAARYGKAVQLIGRWLGIDRRGVVPMAISIKPDEYIFTAVVVDRSKLESSARMIKLELTLPGGQVAAIQLPSFRERKKAPSMLIEWDPVSRSTIRCGEVWEGRKEDDEIADLMLFAESEEDVARLIARHNGDIVESL